jgi:hypothetical protein
MKTLTGTMAVDSLYISHNANLVPSEIWPVNVPISIVLKLSLGCSSLIASIWGRCYDFFNFAKKFGEKMVFWAQARVNVAEKVIITLVLGKKR